MEHLAQHRAQRAHRLWAGVWEDPALCSVKLWWAFCHLDLARVLASSSYPAPNCASGQTPIALTRPPPPPEAEAHALPGRLSNGR
jgi:hypothetical protein